MWPSGRRHFPAKEAYGLKPVSRVRIPPSPPELSSTTFNDVQKAVQNIVFARLFCFLVFFGVHLHPKHLLVDLLVQLTAKTTDTNKMPLTDTACRTTKPDTKPKKLSDGHGMFLLVQPNGAKYWRLAYRFDGKQKILALGVYPETSLAEAREKRTAARKHLASGVDPADAKRKEKQSEALTRGNTFELIAREWHGIKKLSLTDAYATNVLHRLECDVFPTIGNRAISELEAPDILSAIGRLWTSASFPKQKSYKLFWYFNLVSL